MLSPSCAEIASAETAAMWQLRGKAAAWLLGLLMLGAFIGADGFLRPGQLDEREGQVTQASELRILGSNESLANDVGEGETSNTQSATPIGGSHTDATRELEILAADPLTPAWSSLELRHQRQKPGAALGLRAETPAAATVRRHRILFCYLAQDAFGWSLVRPLLQTERIVR